MIRILHIVHSLHEGGVERLLFELCKKIDKNKFEIQVCCLAEKGSLYNEIEKSNIKVHFLDAKRNFSFFNFFINIQRIFRLASILRREHIDITHGHEFFPTVFSRISAVIAGVKFRIITLHNIYYWWSKGIHLIQKVLSILTDFVICNSESTYAYSVEKDKIKENKYRIIYNGIDTEYFSKQNADRKHFEDEFKFTVQKTVCMNVGNISARKGQEFIVKAADSLKKEFPDLVYLLVGGKHHVETQYYDTVKALIKEYGLEDTVIITGKRKDVSRMLNFCDIYLMPSTVEGFGLALAEAMSMERVAIASDIKPFKEIIDDSVDGFLFRSESYSDLADKIKMVIKTDTNTINELRSNARKKIVDKFSSLEMVNHYEDLYNETMVKSSKR